MNIKEAIERVSFLRSDAQRIRKLLEQLDRRDLKGAVEVSARLHTHTQQFPMDSTFIYAGLLKDVLHAQQNANTAEIARLQPVIDMADAALKGLFT